MRKITQQAIAAFYANEDFKSGNTSVEANTINNDVRLYLHGSCIAKRENGILSINPQGHTTNTTKERLNGLTGVIITQRDFTWYLNGEPMSTHEWTVID